MFLLGIVSVVVVNVVSIIIIIDSAIWRWPDFAG